MNWKVEKRSNARERMTETDTTLKMRRENGEERFRSRSVTGWREREKLG